MSNNTISISFKVTDADKGLAQLSVNADELRKLMVASVEQEEQIPLPWDKKRSGKNKAPELTRAEDKKRFDDLLRRLGEKRIIINDYDV